LIPSPILRALSSMHAHGVRSLLMGGQACILYGAAEFSRDTDVVVLASPENLHRLELAMTELQASVVAVPPFDVAYLDRGHAVHFRCSAPNVLGMRIDVMARLRGVDPFEMLWDRRTTIALPMPDESALDVELLALPDLVAAKKTQRDKDWPMLRRGLCDRGAGHRHVPTGPEPRTHRRLARHRQRAGCRAEGGTIGRSRVLGSVAHRTRVASPIGSRQLIAGLRHPEQRDYTDTEIERMLGMTALRVSAESADALLPGERHRAGEPHHAAERTAGHHGERTAEHSSRRCCHRCSGQGGGKYVYTSVKAHRDRRRIADPASFQKWNERSSTTSSPLACAYVSRSLRFPAHAPITGIESVLAFAGKPLKMILSPNTQN